ncbi:hypothetical protein [Mumia zhuanghuii]|nr:hypothetical protein [Mumia zhuanghuii]
MLSTEHVKPVDLKQGRTESMHDQQRRRPPMKQRVTDNRALAAAAAD